MSLCSDVCSDQMRPELLWLRSKPTTALSAKRLTHTACPEWTAIFTAHHNLGGVGAVDPDAQDEQVQDGGRDLVRRWHLGAVVTCDVGLHHRHAVHGERARLVGADGRRVAHCLAGVEVPDQVVVLHHFLGKRGKQRYLRRRDLV